MLLSSCSDCDKPKYLGMQNIKENYYKLKRRPIHQLLPRLTVCDLHSAWKSSRCNPEPSNSNDLVSNDCFWPSLGLQTCHPLLVTTVHVNCGVDMFLPWFSQAT